DLIRGRRGETVAFGDPRPLGKGLGIWVDRSYFEKAMGKGQFTESKHPRAQEGAVDEKYKGGRFVPGNHPVFGETEKEHPKEHVKTAGDKDIYFQPKVTNKTVRDAME